jgi:predicted dehydrogenase
MSRKLTIGVVGGGMVSQIAHLPFYLEDPRCEVLAVAESRPSLVRHLRDHFGVANVVADHRQLLEDSRITALLIIAPRPATGPLALEALEAGKDVIVEKPLAHTVEQAETLVQTADAQQRLLGAAFMKRHDPGIQAAKQEFDRLQLGGELGALLLSRFYDYARDYAHPPPAHKRPEESRAVRFETWPTAPHWLPAERGDDYAWFMNAASHDINLLSYFFPAGLRLVHAASPAKGALTASFEWGEVPVVFELAKSASGTWLQGAEFVFERGRMLVEIPSPMATDRASRVIINESSAPDGMRELAVEPIWSFRRQAQTFVGDLLERRQPQTSGDDALADLKSLEAKWRLICTREALNVQ